MSAAASLESVPFSASSRVSEVAAHTHEAQRFWLEAVSDDALHATVKSLVLRHNALTADLLAHLAEVDARGIYRERACSSLYTYCIYELRLSEDEAQRRVRAARTARAFPMLFEMLADGAIHLTGLLLLAPHLTLENHAGLLARARFRTKREIEHLVAEIAPRPDVPARIEPLGGQRPSPRNSWQAFMASLRGPVRDITTGLDAGRGLPAAGERKQGDAPEELAFNDVAPNPPQFRYRVEFTATERYVELLEEARNLLQHQTPDRDIAKVHELAMAAFVDQLRRSRQATRRRTKRADCDEPAPVAGKDADSEAPAPERDSAPCHDSGQPGGRYVPAEIRREVWRRDDARCTFQDSRGRRCEELAGLELHHEHAFARGGSPTLENLRLLCRAHNTLLAERDFGRAYMRRFHRTSD
jgi:hypothetical protein